MSDQPTNRLAGETSPYLLQHADNPVAWQPWDAASLELAKREDKPILLSIGYSACHWCHVMAHESFEDADVAALMNELFVNVKVDREERPDLDQIYQSAHHLLTGRNGGWPLTMFLTPDGEPFFGGTYFPKSPRYGLPGFADLCRKVETVYRHRQEDIRRQTASLLAAMNETLPTAQGTAILDGRPIALARDMLLENLDSRYGGFGGAPKFPHPTDLAFLLQRFHHDSDLPARDAALLTLRRMAEGGIYDQLGGGFSRYSVDERWEIPHFEKMLYDNGPLLALYAEAWRLTEDPLFKRITEETAAWLMREMQAPDGGYYSSLDADSEGEEGRFYVWERDAVRTLLNPAEWQAASRCWGLDQPPNFEGRHWQLRVVAQPADSEVDALASAREKLFSVREQRIRPGRDEKILTSWNALAIQGMARSARIFGRPDWLGSARRSLAFLRSALWNGGRLLATSKDGKSHLDAYLDDHAFLLAALMEMLQTDFQRSDLDWAIEIAEILLNRFQDEDGGGFYFTAHDHEQLIHRPKGVFDNATPAGNGVAASGLLKLGHLLGNAGYVEAARRTLQVCWAQISQRPVACASLLDVLEGAVTPPSMVILRGPEAEVQDWQRRLSKSWPGLALALPNGVALPTGLDKPETPRVNAWVCSGVTRLAPVEDFNTLIKSNLPFR